MDVFPTHVIIGDDIFYFTIKDHAIIYTKSAIPALKALRIISNDDYNYLVYFLPNIHNYDTDNNETVKRGLFLHVSSSRVPERETSLCAPMQHKKR